MPKMTAKDNYLALIKGEMPESVVTFTMGFPGYKDQTPFKFVSPMLFGPPPISVPPEGRVDEWGVKYVANKETGFGALPEPGNFILKDITKWRDVIKAPTVPDVDWETMAKTDYENAKINPKENMTCMGGFLAPFQQLMGFMGFNEGLAAMYEETETVKELLNYLADFYVPLAEKTVEYYKPEMMYMADDSATKLNPFFSVEMYKDIFKPIYLKLSKPARDRGIPIEFHNCGRAEDFLPDMWDFGVRIWDPAQPQNDLLGVKKRFNNKLAVAGGFEYIPTNWPNVDEEEIRQKVRDTIDKYAAGGGYAFGGNVLTQAGDPMGMTVNTWIMDEAYNYGQEYYSKH
jgi:hypothetical protein